MVDSDGLTTVLFVTGMSGAGRTSVANVLEDDGWYVTDNVPVSVIAQVIEQVRAEGVQGQKIAMVVRAGHSSFGESVAALRDELEADGTRTGVIFVDASDEVLVRRFEQVRRRHPLQGDGTLGEGIAAERLLLADVQAAAGTVIDTSNLSSTRLRAIVESTFPNVGGSALSVAVQSFGFKYGLPIDCDLVIDVRFLPNPYWIPELRDHNGRDAAVRDYVLGQDDALDFIERYTELVGIVARGYRREGKGYMTIGVGCTGGKHRSVAMSTELARRLAATVGEDGEPAYKVQVTHRDLGRE
ncbi:RNase adapter RapZ [Gordonia sp. HY285]|uniref:RNase adapter RapZ n=1 Tax=Gordonia liuliyuniae TaxID=2911517 RepID=A0ABS9IR30_9ACTN|nr:RNase adapter RapZ [Gordonia liuliyuniae]MCF8587982.1 RNase adapter RapZ [Gordonia liuliyuniae]MCF8610678.1 RNase adapter RapZ [Gordonia liuliyuniae]